ncbi:MAG: hypothetical protein DRP87_09860 [Spirochaetes bacterium]|nr:MAG: hypothetical protein DRP87_09860 [Spirochaetota bacterium]
MSIDNFGMDRSRFSVNSIFDETNERQYWLSKTPQERLEAIELMRQINYGYDPYTVRLRRVFEVVHLTSS